MALWIRITENGEMSTTTVSPANGKSFTLEELQKLVGGDIEPLALVGGDVMWLNENGKQDELPFNPVADFIAHRLTGIAWNDGIVGNVVIANREESGE